MNGVRHESDAITEGDEGTTAPAAEALARRLEDAVERSMNDLETEHVRALVELGRMAEESPSERSDTVVEISSR